MARFLMSLGLCLCISAQAATVLPLIADPMEPPPKMAIAAAVSGSEQAEVTLLALKLNGRQSQALFGERWVGVGDLLPQGKVISIDERGARIEQEGRIYRLQLGQSIMQPLSSILRSP